MKTYQAPWSKSLVIVSALVTMLCLGIPLAIPRGVMQEIGPLAVLLWFVPLCLLAGCLPFMIRGYAIVGDAILVKRLFWSTRLPRAGLQSAEVVPGAMRKSLRTCGNGGAFSFTGWYWNKALGHYRAFVTNPNDTVVLRFGKRTVVVSPATPDGFVRELRG
jgi:hypothetical protein